MVENVNKHIDVYRCELTKSNPSCALDIVATIDFFENSIEVTNLCLDNCYYETEFTTDLLNSEYDIVEFSPNNMWDDGFSTFKNEPDMVVAVEDGKMTIISMYAPFAKVRKNLGHNEKIITGEFNERVFYITSDESNDNENNIISIKEETSWSIINEEW